VSDYRLVIAQPADMLSVPCAAVAKDPDPQVLAFGGGVGPRGPQGDTGPMGTVVSDTEPTVAPGESVFWVQSGLGPEGNQYGLFVVTGD
jgi:hypothetical protein